MPFDEVVLMQYAGCGAWTRRAVVAMLAVTAGVAIGGEAHSASAQAESARCSAGRVADEDRSAQTRPAREALVEAAAAARQWIAQRLGPFQPPGVCGAAEGRWGDLGDAGDRCGRVLAATRLVGKSARVAAFQVCLGPGLERGHATQA